MKFIKNGRLILKDRILTGKALAYDGRIVGFVDNDDVPAGAEVMDAAGAYVAPGLIDVHIHGYLGQDVCDCNPDGIRKIAAGIVENGVTGFLPTTMTVDKAVIQKAIDVCRELQEESKTWKGTAILGVHAEGPFINPKKKGAQDEKYILKPDAAFVKKNADMIRIITMAPEMDENFAAIREIVSDTDVVVSMGHTDATYEIAAAAVANGVRSTTHLFNAMPPFNHRDPGVVGAASDDAAHVEMISDGIHLHPAVVRSVFRWFGAERVCLISDSMRAAGMPNGVYSLGGQTVYMTDGKATLEDGTIAGSATCLAECFRRAVSFGVPLDAALRAATINPAQAVGLFDELGSITAGKRADILVLDETLHPEKIFIGGVQTK